MQTIALENIESDVNYFLKCLFVEGAWAVTDESRWKSIYLTHLYFQITGQSFDSFEINYKFEI